jgi:hypothetical protein
MRAGIVSSPASGHHSHSAPRARPTARRPTPTASRPATGALAAVLVQVEPFDPGCTASGLALVVVGVLPERPLVHLDAGYDYRPCRQVLAKRGMVGEIATQDGKLRWGTERRLVVEFWLALANAAIVCGRLLRRAWTCYRWQRRPRRRP